jgi:FtsH-binding integral membrane protein
MSDQFNRGVVLNRAGTDAQIDEGLRAYMLRVYNYMTTGLALTGAVAFIVASTPTVFNAIFGSGLVWVVILAPLGMVFFLSARINKMSAASAQLTYWIFAALMGLSLASVFVVYTGESIARVFFITAATFASMSLYGYTTKRDLTGWGSFLFMGLIGIILDTQKIKEMYSAVDGSEIAGKKAIMGALRLYLDFINLFLMLLHLFGNNK